MTRSLAVAFLLAVGAFAATGMPRPAAAAFDCEAPKDVTRLKVKLPNTARAIRRGEELVIVAVGSSSTEGVGASSAANAYPARLAGELSWQWPGHKIRVVNSGIGGETARDMLARFEKDVLAYRPQLVIWQTGSNTVLKGHRLDEYAETVRKGVKRLKATDTDIILMDPQYAPRVIRQPTLRRMVDFMRQAADELGVGLFQRFAIMRHWVDSGQARVEDMISRDQLHMNDAGYGCIARLLADIVTDVAREASAAEPRPEPRSTAEKAAR
jgi:lysophospholipase L1-like esterase